MILIGGTGVVRHSPSGSVAPQLMDGAAAVAAIVTAGPQIHRAQVVAPLLRRTRARGEAAVAAPVAASMAVPVLLVHADLILTRVEPSFSVLHLFSHDRQWR